MLRRLVVAFLLCSGVAGIAKASGDSAIADDPDAPEVPTTAGQEAGRAVLLDPGDEGRSARRVADGEFRALAAGVYVSGAGDYLTTRGFRERGIEEANPLLGSMADNPAGLAAVKLGGGSVINYIAYNLKKDGKRYWRLPQIVWIALNVAASLHNNAAN